MNFRKSKHILSMFAMMIAYGSILSSGVAADLSALPGFQLPGLSFGMNESDFVQSHPAAQKGAEAENGQQYWVQLDKVYLLDFRLGKLTLVTAVWDKMPESRQRTLTTQLYQQLTQQFGPPSVTKAGKVIGKGVVEVTAMLFDLSGIHAGIKGILESSELELSVTVFDSLVYKIDKLIFKREELLASLRKGSLLQHEQLGAFSIIDFLDDPSASSAGETAQKPLIASPGDLDVSPSSQSGPKEPTSERSADTPRLRSWHLWLVVIVGAIGGLWLVVRKPSV